MDEYLRCLYEYIQDQISAAHYPDPLEYRRRADAAEQAWRVLDDLLPPAQLRLVEDYRAAWTRLTSLEDELLFQAAVSLGKWMAR